MIKFYCSMDDTRWNKHNIHLGDYLCVAPVYGSSRTKKYETRVDVPNGSCEVIQDSGAFSDFLGTRLSFKNALERQEYHAYKYGYNNLITHRASYDLLIDEKWTDDGKRYKERWSVEDGWMAVEETINSAKFINDNRNGHDLVLSAQGVDSNQYLECSKEIIRYMNNGDIFGLGGWCIIGKKKNSLREIFRSTIKKVIPLLGSYGISKVHIWGVMYAPALGELLWICDKYNIKLSTDSSGPQRKPSYGQWGYADWINKNYKKPTANNRWKERERHVKACIGWLENFRDTKYYKSPYRKDKWT